MKDIPKQLAEKVVELEKTYGKALGIDGGDIMEYFNEVEMTKVRAMQGKGYSDHQISSMYPARLISTIHEVSEHYKQRYNAIGKFAGGV